MCGVEREGERERGAFVPATGNECLDLPHRQVMCLFGHVFGISVKWCVTFQVYDSKGRGSRSGGGVTVFVPCSVPPL